MLLLNTIQNKTVRLKPEIIYAPMTDQIYHQHELWYTGWEFEEGTDLEKAWFESVFKKKGIINVSRMYTDLEERAKQHENFDKLHPTA